MACHGYRLLGLATLLSMLYPCSLADVSSRRLVEDKGVPMVSGERGSLWGSGNAAQQRSLLQQGREYIDAAREDLDGTWDGDFIDPSANTVRHICLSNECREQFPKGRFTANITGGGTLIDWVDIEIGGKPKDPALCEADGLADVERPTGFELVKGKIVSYSDNRLILSVSPKDFSHNSGGNTGTREGIIDADPFEWCIKFRVFRHSGNVRGEMRLFEDDFRGTRDEWLELKRTAKNFECLEDGEVEGAACEYNMEDPDSIIVKRAEVIELKCIEGTCLNLSSG